MALSNRLKWQQAVDAWVRSGLSCRDFAARQGLNFRSLSWWKWKLSSPGPADGPPGNRPATISSPSFSFVELVLGSPPSTVPSPASCAAAPFELHWGPVRVSIPQSFDGKALSRLLETLERRVQR